MRLLAAVLLATLVALGMAPPATAAATATATEDKGETVVSFTFDGTFKGQDVAAEILAEHGLAGTFYINSGYIGFPAYLSIDQLRTIARNRSEIGGASLYGNDLSRLSRSRAEREVCDDRTTLAQLGFTATSFAYPHAASPAQAKSVVQACGYNSGREVAGLYESLTTCSDCPAGETLPPTDDFRIRTPGPDTTVPDLKRHVQDVEDAGGGWVPFVFSHVCVCPDKGADAISPSEFETFVRWVANRPGTTSVQTVDQVMGGELKPVVGTPIERLVPDPSPAIGTPRPMSQVAAWTLFGVGIGQSQILLIGMLLTIAIVITFRVATRSHRYGR